MDMRMLGVPVVDGDPVEPRAEIAFDAWSISSRVKPRELDSSPASSGETMNRK